MCLLYYISSVFLYISREPRKTFSLWRSYSFSVFSHIHSPTLAVEDGVMSRIFSCLHLLEIRALSLLIYRWRLTPSNVTLPFSWWECNSFHTLILPSHVLATATWGGRERQGKNANGSCVAFITLATVFWDVDCDLNNVRLNLLYIYYTMQDS